MKKKEILLWLFLFAPMIVIFFDIAFEWVRIEQFYTSLLIIAWFSTIAFVLGKGIGRGEN